MTVLGPLGPWWVARIVLAVAAAGIVTALVAPARRRPFLPWLLCGVSLPVVALPHACVAGVNRAGDVPRTHVLLDRLGRRPATAVIVVVLAITNVGLVNAPGSCSAQRGSTSCGRAG